MDFVLFLWLLHIEYEDKVNSLCWVILILFSCILWWFASDKIKQGWVGIKEEETNVFVHNFSKENSFLNETKGCQLEFETISLV